MQTGLISSQQLPPDTMMDMIPNHCRSTAKNDIWQTTKRNFKTVTFSFKVHRCYFYWLYVKGKIFIVHLLLWRIICCRNERGNGCCILQRIPTWLITWIISVITIHCVCFIFLYVNPVKRFQPLHCLKA